MKRYILALFSITMAVWFLAMAVTLGTVDSMFIDFTQMSASQLELYRYGFFSGFVGSMLGVVYFMAGDSL